MITEINRFEIVGELLFIEGIGIIEGVNAAKYSDIHYSLIFESVLSNKCFEKNLAKTHRPEITSRYAMNGENYDKCYFTTKEWAGISIKDIPIGRYRIKLKIKTPQRTEISYFLSKITKEFSNSQFVLEVNRGTNILNIQELKGINVSTFSSNKFQILGNYIDDCNNTLVSPSGLLNCYVRFKGKNNRVYIHNNVKIKNVNIELMMNNGVVEICENVRMSGSWRVGNNCTLKIGKNSSSTNSVYITCAEGTKVIIGEDCMFATNNQIRTDDAHPIYDVNTGKRINVCEDIILGDHVWVAFGATLLGGANIGSGSIIGAYSLVNKKHSNNCLIVGTPGKTVKQDVFWERTPVLVSSEKPLNFSQQQMLQKAYCRKTKPFD